MDITIYNYEWADDNDYSIWSPYEASVLTMDKETFYEDCRGDVTIALEDHYDQISHTGEYEVATLDEVPKDVHVYGDPQKITKDMTTAILGCPDTLESWAKERRISINEATRQLKEA